MNKESKEYYYSERGRAARKRALEDKVLQQNKRRYIYKKRYGITIEQYDKMYAEQDGKCLICKKECRTYDKLTVDHDHSTGEFRGLLCSVCNRGLGMFYDNTKLLEQAIKYLDLTNEGGYNGIKDRVEKYSKLIQELR
tara:strand:+ start:21471 stop:21884 length:414 start_codon:yes stop_codon:yes gene_type:complete